jgi:hypothetical protein
MSFIEDIASACLRQASGRVFDEMRNTDATALERRSKKRCRGRMLDAEHATARVSATLRRNVVFD